MMYMREPRGEVAITRLSAAAAIAIAVCVAATLYLGVLPGRVLDYVAHSAHELVSDATTASAMAASSSVGP
jgi:NADH:ubiquinone oxidoreductase subunit 4 (subunit M)